jgi:hypothetical protein
MPADAHDGNQRRMKDQPAATLSSALLHLISLDKNQGRIVPNDPKVHSFTKLCASVGWKIQCRTIGIDMWQHQAMAVRIRWRANVGHLP